MVASVFFLCFLLLFSFFFFFWFGLGVFLYAVSGRKAWWPPPRVHGCCHGVKVAARVSVESCCLTVGEIVSYENVLSASRLNSVMVIFLSSVDKAIQRGIIIDGVRTPVLPLSLPSKKVTLSNVPCPGISIFDNIAMIWDTFDVSKLLNIDTGLI